MSMEKREIKWDVCQVFERNHVIVEVSKSDGYQTRYSYRVTWKDGERKGPWFPDRGISFLEDLSACVASAEEWILDRRNAALKIEEDKLALKKESELAKRKRHEQNVEARKDQNRKQTAVGKGGRG